MGKYQGYERYKESGVECLGDIPEHWQVIPIKFSLSMPITDGPHETPEMFDEGVPFISAEAIKNDEINFEKKRGFISREEHQRFSKKYSPKYGDVYMVKSGATTGNVARVKTHQEFNIWSPLAVLRPNEEKTTTDFLFHTIKSKYFFYSVEQSWSFGTQQNIGMGVISNIRVSFPPLDEQESIACFLDRKTSQIDALIAKKAALLEKLDEKRTALISHAVTKGLDSSVPMKDSGVEWLGDIPEHWELVGLTKYLKSLVDYRGKTPEKMDDGIFLVTAKNIKGGIIDYSLSQEFVKEEEYEDIMRRGKPEIGDVLLTTEAPLGEVANVDNVDIALAQRIVKLQGKINVLDNYFLKYWMIGKYFNQHLQSLCTGSTALGIKASKFCLLKVV